MRRPRAAAALAAAAVLAALLAATKVSPAAAEQPPAALGAGKLVRLSDKRTLSRWAYPTSAAVVRASPAVTARALGRLRFLTSDEQAELYLALASTRDAAGRAWLRIELPGRPNGQSGWVPRGALGTLNAVAGYLRIDRASLRATLYRGGRAIFSAPVGIGKPGTVTPRGDFYVMEKLRAVGAPVFGPYAIGTSAYAPTLSEWPGGGVVGIHGTDQPQLIPGRPSHGCIRMRNADITRLWRILALGTPIEIS